MWFGARMADGATTSADRGGALKVLAGGFLISFSAVFVKVSATGPIASGFYRVLFGGTCLAALALVQGKRRRFDGRRLLWAAVAGAFFAFDLGFWHHSIHYVGPGLATILANFQVFFMAAAGVWALGERPDWRFYPSVPLAVAGLALLVGMDFAELGPRYRWGVVFGVLTALAYTGYLLSLRQAQRRPGAGSPVGLLAVVSFITAAFLAVEMARTGESFVIPDAGSWGALLAYGALCQATGWMLITRGLAATDASKAGLLLLVQPTMTFIWDMLLFARPTTVVELAGAAVALLAIYLGNLRRS